MHLQARTACLDHLCMIYDSTMPLSPFVGSDTTNDAMLQIHAFRQLFCNERGAQPRSYPAGSRKNGLMVSATESGNSSCTESLPSGSVTLCTRDRCQCLHLCTRAGRRFSAIY